MDKPEKISIMYEVTARCNQSCTFCYNTWKTSDTSPIKQLSTRQAINLLAKVIDETDGCDISLSGGEPLLRDDIFELISFIKAKNVKVNLISNGTLLTDENVDRCISSGIDAFQVTLLSDKPGLHNRLASFDGFEKVLDAILNIRKRNGTVYIFFVGLSDNIYTFKGTVELAILLGVRNVALGRFTVGGSGLSGWEKRMPEPRMIAEALEAGNEACKKYQISVAVSTPILPCLVDINRFEHIRFGFCSVGNSRQSLFGIDPGGNLKACSHSPYILGNLLEQPFDVLLQDPFLAEFISTAPAFCRDCPDLPLCRGGCRSSAHVTYGSFAEEDPLLHLYKNRARKPVEPTFSANATEPSVGC
jgi:radical SAM protein with 4Fe4S-binding SPASM domain